MVAGKRRKGKEMKEVGKGGRGNQRETTSMGGSSRVIGTNRQISG